MRVEKSSEAALKPPKDNKGLPSCRLIRVETFLHERWLKCLIIINKGRCFHVGALEIHKQRLVQRPCCRSTPGSSPGFSRYWHHHLARGVVSSAVLPCSVCRETQISCCAAALLGLITSVSIKIGCDLIRRKRGTSHVVGGWRSKGGCGAWVCMCVRVCLVCAHCELGHCRRVSPRLQRRQAKLT